jgi:hypothetical protein
MYAIAASMCVAWENPLSSRTWWIAPTPPPMSRRVAILREVSLLDSLDQRTRLLRGASFAESASARGGPFSG